MADQVLQRDQAAGVAQACLAMAFIDGELADAERVTLTGILQGCRTSQ